MLDQLLQARLRAMLDEDSGPLPVVAEVLHSSQCISDHIIIGMLQQRKKPELSATLQKERLREGRVLVNGIGGEVGREKEGKV